MDENTLVYGNKWNFTVLVMYTVSFLVNITTLPPILCYRYRIHEISTFAWLGGKDAFIWIWCPSSSHLNIVDPDVMWMSQASLAGACWKPLRATMPANTCTLYRMAYAYLRVRGTFLRMSWTYLTPSQGELNLLYLKKNWISWWFEPILRWIWTYRGVSWTYLRVSWTFLRV